MVPALALTLALGQFIGPNGGMDSLPGKKAPPVPVFLATFASLGAYATEDSNTVTHVTWTGGALADSKALGWAQQGTVPVTSGPLYPNGLSGSAGQVAGNFSDSNYYLGPSGSLGLSGGKFTALIRFVPADNTTEYVPLGVNNGTVGWTFDRTNTGTASAYVSGTSPQSVNTTTINALNTVCMGRDGSGNAAVQLNAGSYVSLASGFNAPTALSPALGRHAALTGYAFAGKIAEVYVTSTPISSGLCASLFNQTNQLITDSGHTLTITRAASATDTVHGSSVTFVPGALRVNEAGALFATSGDQATVDPTGLVNWQSQKGAVTAIPQFASGGAVSTRCVFSMNAWSLCYTTGDQWQLTVGGVQATSTVQSFLSGTSHTVAFRWQVGATGSACIKVDSQAEVCAATAPAPIAWAPPEKLYFGGTASTVANMRITSAEIDRVGAGDLGELPGGPAMVLDANSIDKQGNITITSGTAVGTWSNLAAAPYCSDCQATTQSTSYLKPVAFPGVGGSSWGVETDGTQSQMTSFQSGVDLTSIYSGSFETVICIRRAGTSDTNPFNAIASPHRGMWSVVNNTSTTTAWLWQINAAGAQRFVVQGAAGIALDTGFVGSAHPGDWVCYDAYADTTQGCVSTDFVNFTCVAKGAPAWPAGGTSDAQLSFPSLPIDGDIGLLVGYTAPLTTQQRARLKLYAQRWSKGRPGLVACLGHSQVTNFAGTTFQSWCHQAQLSDGAGRLWGNFGVSGTEVDNINSRYTSDIQGRGYSVVVDLSTINSIKNNVLTEAQIESYLQSTYDAAIADGSKLVIVNALPFGTWTGWTSALQTRLVDINAWQASYVAAHPTKAVLLDAYSRYGDAQTQPFGEVAGSAVNLGSGCASSDGLHLGNQTCEADLAAQVLAAVNSLP